MSLKKTDDAFEEWLERYTVDTAGLHVFLQIKADCLAAWRACEAHFQKQIRALGLKNAGQAGRMWAAQYELELLESHLQYIEEANTRLAEAEQMLQDAKEKIRRVRGMRTLYDIDRGR